MASPAGGGPGSPRGQWPPQRGSVAEAAANALSKGSPRGVTPTGSSAFLGSAAQGSSGSNGTAPAVAAAAAKLQKLSVGGTMGGAPSAPIHNQVRWLAGLAGAGVFVRAAQQARPLGTRQLTHSPSRPFLPISMQGLRRVDTMGQVMSPTSMKRRGLKVGEPCVRCSSPCALPLVLACCPTRRSLQHSLTTPSSSPPLAAPSPPTTRAQAASFHKTSIDSLLHPRQAGANPYRIVLGEVSKG